MVDAIFLDSREVFDTAPHSIFFGKTVQLWGERVQGVLGEELAEGQSSEGSTGLGYTWLATGHLGLLVGSSSV